MPNPFTAPLAPLFLPLMMAQADPRLSKFAAVAGEGPATPANATLTADGAYRVDLDGNYLIWSA